MPASSESSSWLSRLRRRQVCRRAPIGARVSAVTPRSPAAEADLRVGDVILRYAGTEIEDDAQLINLVSLSTPGEAAEVVYLRDGAEATVSVRVGTLEPETPEK